MCVPKYVAYHVQMLRILYKCRIIMYLKFAKKQRKMFLSKMEQICEEASIFGTIERCT